MLSRLSSLYPNYGRLASFVRGPTGESMNVGGFLSPNLSQAYGTLQSGANIQKPFYGAGLYGLSQAIPEYTYLMHDPTGFTNQIFSSYNMSPYAQYQMSQINQAANAQAALAGSLGTPNQQYDLAKQEQGIVSKDQQQYYQDVMQPFQLGLRGEQTLAGMGQHAADQLSNLKNVEAALQAAQASEGLAGLGGLLGGIGSAAMGLSQL